MTSQSTFADLSPQAGQGLRQPTDINLSFLKWVFWNYYRWRCPRCDCRLQARTYDALPEQDSILEILDAPFCESCAASDPHCLSCNL